MKVKPETYTFPWSTMDGQPIDVTIQYLHGIGEKEIVKVFMENIDITDILDNEYLYELLYDALYEYDQGLKGEY